MITIHVFQEIFQQEIDVMMAEIDQEFDQSIFSSSTSKPVPSIDKFWVAFHYKEVIGTAGVLGLENKKAVLKSMFVKKKFRGSTLGISSLLLQNFFDWCKNENIDAIYLGTMSQFKAAHHFYEKNGFQQIAKSELPKDFIMNPLDDVFYKLMTNQF